MAAPPGLADGKALRPAQSAGRPSQSGKISSFQGEGRTSRAQGFFLSWFQAGSAGADVRLTIWPKSYLHVALDLPHPR